jgi:hypothetical protein
MGVIVIVGMGVSIRISETVVLVIVGVLSPQAGSTPISVNNTIADSLRLRNFLIPAKLYSLAS